MRTQTLLRGSLALLLAGSALLAQAAPMPTVKPLRGTVDSVQGDTLDVTTRGGAHQIPDAGRQDQLPRRVQGQP
ncbi:hypothetical protein Q3H58_001510 [Pseudomonas psychrotolerans]|nr:hypothetical protein [Pseudomonas psychrotolerans]